MDLGRRFEVHEFVFVIKFSKFCNLRCAYCYEHRELHIHDGMDTETARRLFADVDELGTFLNRIGWCPKFSFVWHGGEPLLLPPDYYRRIAALQSENIRQFGYRNSVQTNLFGCNQESLKFVLDVGWELGVSIDFAEGIRINAGGRDSNKTVMAAAEDLHRSGAKFGVISVLGAHNRDALPEAYDWVSEFAEGWRILPAFAGGPEESMARLQLQEEDVVQVLMAVFEKRANAKKHIPIAPIDDYIKAAALEIAGQSAHGDVDRDVLDNIFVINVNGDVFTRPFAYDPQFRLGNIACDSMTDIVGRETYRSCQAAIRQRKIRNCASCDYRGICNTSPMHEHGSVTKDGACVVPRRSIAEIGKALTAAGVDRSVLADWARETWAI